MVSIQITGFHIPESRQQSRLAERIKLDDDGRSERPFLKSEQTQWLWSRGEFRNGCWLRCRLGFIRGDLSGWFPSAAGKPTSQSAEKRRRLFILHTDALRQLMFVLVSLMDENEINSHLCPDEILQLHLTREILRAVFLQTLHHGFGECQIH